MAKKFIQKAIKHPGALHKQLGVPQGEKIPAEKLAAAAKKGGKLGQRARFAQTLKKLHESRGEFYTDKEGGDYHVFHSETGKSHASYSSEEEAKKKANELNRSVKHRNPGVPKKKLHEAFFDPDETKERTRKASMELKSAEKSKQVKQDLHMATKKKKLMEDLTPVSDIISLVANQQYSDATNIMHDVLGSHVLNALQERKQVIAQSLFVPSADSLSEEIEQLDELKHIKDLEAHKVMHKGKHIDTIFHGGNRTKEELKKSAIKHGHPHDIKLVRVTEGSLSEDADYIMPSGEKTKDAKIANEAWQAHYESMSYRKMEEGYGGPVSSLTGTRMATPYTGKKKPLSVKQSEKKFGKMPKDFDQSGQSE